MNQKTPRISVMRILGAIALCSFVLLTLNDLTRLIPGYCVFAFGVIFAFAILIPSEKPQTTGDKVAKENA